MELERRESSDSRDQVHGSRGAGRSGSKAPGKPNTAQRVYGGVPAPAGAPALDWGAALDASRAGGEGSAHVGGRGGDGPGYALSRAEADMAVAAELLQKTHA